MPDNRALWELVEKELVELNDYADRSDACRYGTLSTSLVRDYIARISAILERPVVVGDDSASFKNFHRSLCDRFGYTHDEKDWRRDLVSLEEWIARSIAVGQWQEMDSAPKDKAIMGAWFGSPLYTEIAPVIYASHERKWMNPDGMSDDWFAKPDMWHPYPDAPPHRDMEPNSLESMVRGKS